MTNIPHYIKRQVAEGGTVQDEILVALVEAVEEQTAVLSRIAAAMESDESPDSRGMAAQAYRDGVEDIRNAEDEGIERWSDTPYFADYSRGARDELVRIGLHREALQACETALRYCQSGDVQAAAHILHSAIAGAK